MPDWLEVIVRTFTFIVLLFFMTKILAKKQLAELNVFEYIFGIVIGSVVAIFSSTLDIPFYFGILSMLTLFAVLLTGEYISLKNKRFRDFFQGKSTVFIQNGKIMEDNLKKEGYTADDLLEKLRNKNIFQVSDVEFALLEPTGSLNVMPKKENQPLTPKDMGMNTPSKKAPQNVIMDGRMLLEPLANLSLSKQWLESELEKKNVSIDNVFLGQADSDAQLSIDLYDDQITVPQPSEKPLLLASMKKCQADLDLFALATENVQSRQQYERNSQKIEDAIQLVTPHLKS
ncbi:MAG TPA: DUF421 domain-containing protein [Bacillota bacterium]|nr:DUF421 domain-containing protein [Bacillota bacterium]